MFDNDNFGSYKTPQQAVDDVAGGYTSTPSVGIDFDEMGVSGDLDDWERKLFAKLKKMRPG